MSQSTGHLIAPQAPPDLHIPPSSSTVTISIIDTTSHIVLPLSAFLSPDIKGFPDLSIPAYSFLIHHAPTNKRILFDLGVRPDWKHLPPAVASRIESAKWTVHASQSTASLLSSNGVAPSSIDQIIWSHHHWDHIGDLTTFPPTTSLLVGPGFTAANRPGYPERPSAPVHEHDFAPRSVTEPSFPLKIGRFAAADHFGDGSLYLLDTPGHSAGHICALARTTPDTFVFLAGDACHTPGEFRPSPYLPLPKEVKPWGDDGGAVAGEALRAVQRDGRADEAFFRVKESFPDDLALCEWTIEGVQEFDAHEKVLVLMAHDATLGEDVPLWPGASLNGWHADGVGERVRWKFLTEFREAVEAVEA